MPCLGSVLSLTSNLDMQQACHHATTSLAQLSWRAPGQHKHLSSLPTSYNSIPLPTFAT